MKKLTGDPIVDLERERVMRALGQKKRSTAPSLSLRKLAKRGTVAPGSLSLAEVELVCTEVLTRLEAAHAAHQAIGKADNLECAADSAGALRIISKPCFHKD